MSIQSAENSSRLPTVFVWGVWAAAAIGAIVFVLTFGWPFPIQDDLEYAPFAGRERTFDWEWIWHPHVEHRLPIHRLILITLLRLTHDFRSGMVAEVVVLAALSAAMMLSARRLRGRTSYTDAFFPLVLLHTGNAENLLMAHQLSLMLPVAFSAAILLLLLRSPEPPSGGRLAWIAVCLLALPLNGGHGLVQTPAWILALAVIGWNGWRSHDPRTRRAGVATLAVAAAALLVVVLYFVGYQPPKTQSYNATVGEVWQTAVRFASIGFGPCGEPGWPWTGWIVGAIWIATITLVVRTLRRSPEEHVRAIAIAAQIAAIASMGVSVGIGRGGSGAGAGFAWRYFVLPAPALCAAYFAWMLFGTPAASRFARVLLNTIAASLLFYNADFGRRYGEHRLAVGQAFADDVRAEMSFWDLARKHAPHLYGRPRGFAMHLERLWESGLPPYERDIPDRPFHMMEVAPTSAPPIDQLVARQVHDREALVLRIPSELRFAAPQHATRVCGLYGASPSSWQKAAGAPQRFRVVAVRGVHETVLLERVLDPRNDASHRGLTWFDVALPAADVSTEGLEVVLRVTLEGRARGPERAAWSRIGFR